MVLVLAPLRKGQTTTTFTQEDMAGRCLARLARRDGLLIIADGTSIPG
jgi:hypothetical protein